MIKIVIVEDEMLVRLGMKVCLEEYDDQISVVETFSSGEEAEKYFCEKTADVLITDIRLTGESGLELIEKVRLSHTNMLILVLSCYEDFSYARKAMELGVDKYMLKHELSDDDLPKEVMKLVAGRKKVSYTSEVEKNKEEKGISGEFAEDNLFSMGYLILRGESDISNAGRNQVDLKLLAEIVQKILNIFSLGECYLRREEEIFLIFSFDRKFSQEERRKRVTDFYENLRQNIRNYFDRNLYLVLSDEFQDPSEVRPTFEQLKMDAASVFYFDDSVLLFQENIQKKSRECPKFSLEKQQGLDSMWFQKEKKHLNSFFQEAKRNLAKPQELKILIVKYFCDLEYVLKTDYGSDFLEKNFTEKIFPDYLNIDAYDSGKLLEQWALQLLDKLVLCLEENESAAMTIRRYLESHYQEELGLEQVAEQFKMSPAYFCQYFKKHTGTTFVAYLNNLRIKKAKELLRTTEYSTEQIAEKIGIPNTNYFVRLFKKITGRTVGTYRREKTETEKNEKN